MDQLTAISEQGTEEHWVSISDMMTGLMVIFLFIAISYMLYVYKDREKIRIDKEKIEQIAVTYEKLQEDLYKDLEAEFRGDLEKWNAILDRQTLAVRFREPEVLFAPGEVEVRPAFQAILDDFFPRYLDILRKPEYINDIAEVRIEGHTSSEWMGAGSLEAYIHNMELSQGRTRSVLQYIFDIPQIRDNEWVRNWLKGYLTANGLSSSRLITDSNNIEDREESRRVEFRVRTNAEKRIVEIIKRGGNE